MLAVICSDAYSGHGIALVEVVCWGKHHGCLVCLCVLMVEVHHTPAAVMGGSLTVEKQVEEDRCDQKRREFYCQGAQIYV